MKSIRTLIVDDEPAARRGVRLRLADRQGMEVIGEAGDGEAAVAAIESERPDLVFLDIRMPGLDGFQVVERIGPDAMPATLFLTAYERYALRAFEIAAVDYLLKPIDDERFERALARTRALLADRRLAADGRRLADLLASRPAGSHRGGDGPQPAERLLVASRGRKQLVRVDELDWLEADDDYVRLHAGRRRLLLRGTLKELERRLDPSRFLRIHKSTIVNLDRVRELRPTPAGDYRVHLEDGTELRLSRGYRRRFEAAVAGRPLRS